MNIVATYFKMNQIKIRNQNNLITISKEYLVIFKYQDNCIYLHNNLKIVS